MSAKAHLATARMGLTAVAKMARALGQEPLAELAELALEQSTETPSEIARRAKDVARKRCGIRTDSRRIPDGFRAEGEGGVGGGVVKSLEDKRDQAAINHSSLSPEGVQGEVRTDSAADSAPIPPTQRYRESYERGVSSAIKRPYAMPRKAEGELHQALKAHANGRRGEHLLSWIETDARSFAMYVLSLPEADAKFWSDCSPVGFLRWLNKGLSKTGARAGETAAQAASKVLAAHAATNGAGR